MELKPTLETLDTLDVDAIVLGLCSDIRPPSGVLGLLDWRLCGSISDLIKKGIITGKSRESVLISTQGRIKSERVFLFGFGDRQSPDFMPNNLRYMLSMLEKAKVKRCALALPGGDEAMKVAGGLLRQTLPFNIAGIFQSETNSRLAQ